MTVNVFSCDFIGPLCLEDACSALYSFISDMYKDLHGVRPHYGYDLSYDELTEWADQLCEDHKAEAEYERQQKEEFEAACQQPGAIVFTNPGWESDEDDYWDSFEPEWRKKTAYVPEPPPANDILKERLIALKLTR